MKKLEEKILAEICRDIENLNDNNEKELMKELINNSDSIEERIANIIEALEEENEVEFEGEASDYTDYYIDRLTIYID